jgi:hypothetical protein
VNPLIVAALCISIMATALQAQTGSSSGATIRASDLKISTVEKRLDKQEREMAYQKVRRENWCYEVTLELAGFKAAEGVEVEYRVFKLDEMPAREKVRLVGRPGSEKIAVLKPREKFVFQSAPVEITIHDRDSSYEWATGVKMKSADKLSGIWIKVFQNGKQVAEYCRPTGLKNQEKW